MVAAIPVDGDTLVLNITKALLAHGLSLEPVSRDYTKEGGASFKLLQKHDCKLVVRIKLTNLKGNTMSHSVAWGVKVITDSSHNCSE